jgi:hypothetical protein
MHYPGQQEMARTISTKPCKEQHNARDGVPGYSLGLAMAGSYPPVQQLIANSTCLAVPVARA